MDEQPAPWCRVLSQWKSNGGILCVQVVKVAAETLRQSLHDGYAIRVCVLDSHGEAECAFTINGSAAEELFGMMRRAQAYHRALPHELED